MADALDDYIASRPDPMREGGPLHWCVFMHQELGLPMAPLPSAFLDALDRRDEWVFSTRASVDDLSQLSGLVEEAADGKAPPYLAMGHVRGTSPSYVFVCVLPKVAIFFQHPHGGPGQDAAATGAAIADALGVVGRMLADIDEADIDGQYVIDHRGVFGNKWVLRKDGVSDWLWNGSGDPLGDAYLDFL